MINFLLKNPSLYRLYQKTVRRKYDEYNFIKFIFEKNFFKNIRMLDICCGDSYILDYISEFIDDYLGADNNDKYLKQCKERWKKFNFINLDLNDSKIADHFLKFKPNSLSGFICSFLLLSKMGGLFSFISFAHSQSPKMNSLLFEIGVLMKAL